MCLLVPVRTQGSSDLRKAAEVSSAAVRFILLLRPLLFLVLLALNLLLKKKELDKVFTEAGFEWREAGCSMCLAMNDDIVPPGRRCASTSNRNFEGRQGNGSRTHLVSPEMAAAAAVAGHFVDVRQFAPEVLIPRRYSKQWNHYVYIKALFTR